VEVGDQVAHGLEAVRRAEKMSVHPSPACTRPSSVAADSSVRTTVVPTARWSRRPRATLSSEWRKPRYP
jgi:hypothetical protein